MAQGFSLKDQLFNQDTVTQLGMDFERAGVFNAAPFVDQVMADLLPLELKERMVLIGNILADHLPKDFAQAAQAIKSALPPPLDPGKSDDDFGQFIYGTLGNYIEAFGLQDHPDVSLDLIEDVTQRFSMELSIRAFLNTYPDRTLDRMKGWAHHPHYHVRRLVSEGTRPKLPWGKAVQLTPEQTLPFLDQLHGDATRFVTRSVANHLNDLSKSDPDLVIDRLEAWQDLGKQAAKELDWMRRHALRTLIKNGHARAMSHLGYTAGAAVSVTDFAISPTALQRGAHAMLECQLSVPNPTPMIVDYVVDFVKADGKTAPKTFKWKVLTATPGKPVSLQKRHHFKADATTFTLHPGAHSVHLQINGQRVAQAQFELT